MSLHHAEKNISAKMRGRAADDHRGFLPHSALMLWRLIGIGLVLGLVPVSLCAQIFTGTINGEVRDPSQAPVPGAIVTVTNVATSEARRDVTTSDGLYSIGPLNPGDYLVTVSKAGFSAYKHSGISLQASQALKLDVQLTIGTVAQEVTVTSAPSLLDTEDANRNVTLSSQALLSLPNNSHSSLGAVWATGGVTSFYVGMNGNSPTSGDQNMGRFALDGGRDQASAILVDGISVTGGDWGSAIGLPSAEMVGETQVYRNTFDTQYGKTDGGVVSLTTRNGSATLHGAAYEYWQSQELNANTWLSDFSGIAKTPYSQNLFGGHLSGPIWRSRRIFYFGNYEGTRESAPGTLLTTVPTTAERTGDFSQTLNSNGTLSVIYNPFSTTLGSNGSYTRQPFVGNIIPSGLINPVGSQIANLFPQPNRSGALNFAVGGTSSTTLNRMDFRSDWVVNNKISTFGTFTKLWWTAAAPIFVGHGLDNNDITENPTYRALLSGTYVASPTFVVNVTGATSAWRQLQISPSTIAGANGSIYGFPQSLVSAFPTNTVPGITFENYLTLGNARTLIYILHNNDFQVNATKTHNRQIIKFGYQMTVQLLNDNDQKSGAFAFNRGMTSGPTAATDSSVTGDALASTLLGTMSSASVTDDVAPASAQKYLAWYGEDSWKATDRLTVNYGLRYEIQFARTERHNAYNDFDENATNPLSQETGLNLKGGLVYTNSSNRGLWDTDYKNLAPRIGLAYQAADNLVFRAGYGIFHTQTISAAPTLDTDGYSVTTPAVASVNNNGFIPQNLISNPFPSGLLQPIGSSQGLLTEVGNSVNAFLRIHPTSYVESYSADIEYQAPHNGVVQIGYQGSQGRKLAVGYSLNLNQLNPQYLSLGSALNIAVQNPFYGVLTSGPLASATVARNQLLLPYPQFTSIALEADQPMASSGYNALLASYSQRMGQSLTMLFNYQWSKAIDNTSETTFSNDAARDVYDLALERSVSSHDVPQYFTGTLIWQLPFGHGRQFGSQMNRIVDAFVGNWQVSTITSLVSGQPLEFSCPNTLSAYGFAVCRPNIPNEAAVSLGHHRTLQEWFNTSSSVVSEPAPYTIGTGPRYLSAVRTDALERGDLNVRKSFVVAEGKTVSIQANVYNVSNTPNYGTVNTTIGSPSYGEVTGTSPDGVVSGLPRTVELSARFSF